MREKRVISHMVSFVCRYYIITRPSDFHVRHLAPEVVSAFIKTPIGSVGCLGRYVVAQPQVWARLRITIPEITMYIWYVR